MSRQFRATKNNLTQHDDVQRQIDYFPSNVQVFRVNSSEGGFNYAPGPLSFVSSFQALIVLHERLTKGMIELKEPYGQVSKLVYIMVTEPVYDINGNYINIQQGDYVFDGSVSYFVDSVASFSFKLESILEYLQ